MKFRAVSLTFASLFLPNFRRDRPHQQKRVYDDRVELRRQLDLLAPQPNRRDNTRRDQHGAGGIGLVSGRLSARRIPPRLPASNLRFFVPIRRPAARASHDSGGLGRRCGRVHVFRLGINRETGYFATATRAFHNPGGGHLCNPRRMDGEASNPHVV